MKRIRFVIAFVLVSACVDRLTLLPLDQNSDQLVIQGLITDQPGPYEVSIFKSSGVADNLENAIPFKAKEVTIADDKGNEENLVEREPGIYVTSQGGIQGKIGDSYYLKIVTLDGSVLESSLQPLLPVQAIDSIYFNFESVKLFDGSVQTGFRVFMDTKSSNVANSYVRWRFKGYYMVRTYPEFKQPTCVAQDMHDRVVQPPLPVPPECSGAVFNGRFVQTVGECTCCFCWIREGEPVPILNSDLVPTDGNFRKVEVGYVPYNAWRFWFNRYMVTVEQQSLTEVAYQFWKIIKDQKTGINSLFQPAFGKVRTNITSTNPEDRIVGLFSASAVASKTINITSGNAAFPPPSLDVDPEFFCPMWEACDVFFENASRTPPIGW